MGKARNLANLIADGAIGTTEIADGAVTQQKIASAIIPVGVGQTWQNLTASRASNVTYTNTTGRPIVVSVTAVNLDRVRLNLVIDGLEVARQAAHEVSGNTDFACVTSVVPAGSTYLSNIDSGSLEHWRELR